jgi:hypothetical protein
LVHFDYSLYEHKKELKLIAHRPLDLEMVYKFNRDLFLAILSAGVFDSYFTTVISSGLKGIEELAKRNQALLYPLKWFWRYEAAISWINENPYGYKILEKLFNQEQLDQHETDLAKKMHVGDFTLVAEDENCNINGLSYFGYIILERYKKGQTDIRMT